MKLEKKKAGDDKDARQKTSKMMKQSSCNRQTVLIFKVITFGWKWSMFHMFQHSLQVASVCLKDGP